MTKADDRRLVTVCSECLTAACFRGEFMCENSRCASTTQRTVAQLRKLGLEHWHYWEEGRPR